MRPPPTRSSGLLAAGLLALSVCLATAACSAPSEVREAATAPSPVSSPIAAAPTVAPTPEAAPTQRVAPGRRLRKDPVYAAAKRAEAAARRAADQNPLGGRAWGVYRGDADQAWAPYESASGETRSLLATIALTPKAKWFGDWIADSDIGAKVDDYIANAQDGDPEALVQMAVFRMEPWEHEACRRLPGPAEQASYKRWIDSFAAAVGDTPAAIILQPDGPFALCVPGGVGVPSSLIRYSAEVFGALPRASVYIDAGAADWPAEGQGGVGATLDFLIPAGVEHVRGFALNSTHYSSTAAEVARGAALVQALAARGITDKHFVVNTSSNGRPFVFGDYRGPDPDNAHVCTSPSQQTCVALGIPPTAEVARPAVGAVGGDERAGPGARRRVPVVRPTVALPPERPLRPPARAGPGPQLPLLSAGRMGGPSGT